MPSSHSLSTRALHIIVDRYVVAKSCIHFVVVKQLRHSEDGWNGARFQVKWGDKQEEAFTKIKECLSSEPILKLPDLNREFILQTDAPNQSLGGMSVTNAWRSEAPSVLCK